MTEQLSRITIKEATSSGPIAGLTTIVGYVIQFEPEAPAKREILRPVEPDEPNTEVEVGYSRNALEPTTIEYKSRKTELTVSEYRLFRYVNDRHRLEEQSEFDFAELSEALTGDECAMTQNAIGAIVRRLVKAMSDLSPPITLSIVKETLHVNSVE